MTTMNVSLPSDLKNYVYSQVRAGSYGSTSEYVRELIRRDHDRRELRTALLDGARSPIAASVDGNYFSALRNQAEANG